MYIVRPELDDEALRAAVQSVRGLIESQGGEVVKTTLWGKRRLAYEVSRLRDGHYVLVVFRADGGRVAPLERALRIHDNIFRHLLVQHQGTMPEPDGEIEEAHLEEAAPVADAEATVATTSAETAQDEEDEDLAEAPSASDEEGDI
ncbi:MAG: 30S ribosomal protein S6 [Candidatus Dormibacteraeota bacterium]|nr:30S ribosomal protein S6 [Candidatus Dormibacteraeota bacterium]